MGTPTDPDARLFYRVAKERFADAEHLLANRRTTGAVYLAGYSVECMLKALVLAAVPDGEREEVVGEFRGARAHDYDWLSDLYLASGGPPPPKSVRAQFRVVGDWATDLRYRAGTIHRTRATEFLEAARGIMTWADRRL
jgi:hypothetical protein